jgi:hypothetical protein
VLAVRCTVVEECSLYRSGTSLLPCFDNGLPTPGIIEVVPKERWLIGRILPLWLLQATSIHLQFLVHLNGFFLLFRQYRCIKRALYALSSPGNGAHGVDWCCSGSTLA